MYQNKEKNSTQFSVNSEEKENRYVDEVMWCFQSDQDLKKCGLSFE